LLLDGALKIAQTPGDTSEIQPSGLSMELMLDPEEYVPQLSTGTGFQVTISSPGERPNPAKNGFQVRPGSEVDIGFKLQTVERLPPPYESLSWDDWNETPFQPFHLDRIANKTYRLQNYSYDVSRSTIRPAVLSLSLSLSLALSPAHHTIAMQN
jgi:hypothetical protein